MTSPPDRHAALRIRAKQRRGGLTTAPCPEYQVTNLEDYGYKSCERCGWNEPEHFIDQLLAALITQESPERLRLGTELVNGLRERAEVAEAELARVRQELEDYKGSNARLEQQYRGVRQERDDINYQLFEVNNKLEAALAVLRGQPQEPE